MMVNEEILERLGRMESMLAIQQLAIRYALAVDGRDIETWLRLFVEDVDCGPRGIGREALRPRIEGSLSNVYRTIHYVCGHEIEFDDRDHARG